MFSDWRPFTAESIENIFNIIIYYLEYHLFMSSFSYSYPSILNGL